MPIPERKPLERCSPFPLTLEDSVGRSLRIGVPSEPALTLPPGYLKTDERVAAEQKPEDIDLAVHLIMRASADFRGNRGSEGAREMALFRALDYLKALRDTGQLGLLPIPILGLHCALIDESAQRLLET